MVHPVESGECNQVHFVVTVVSPTVVVVTEEMGNSMLNADRAIIAAMTNATATTATLQKSPMTCMATWPQTQALVLPGTCPSAVIVVSFVGISPTGSLPRYRVDRGLT